MRRVVVLSAVLLAIAACSNARESETQSAAETIAIQMRDNRFEPSRLNVKRGETVSFRFVNRGGVPHDAFIGDKAAQERHEREMRTMGDEHAHHMSMSDNAVTVEPGNTATIDYQFTRRGTILIGCHESGHYASGMVVKVSVT
jgi:uncharacterized cupredoxin-like copper-binding protein